MTISIAYQYAASMGLQKGSNRVTALGNNADVDALTQPEDVWSGADIGLLNSYDHRLIPFPVNAISMEIVSSSADDSIYGTGARQVLVNYLDSEWGQKLFVVNMNGLTPVIFPEPVLRVNQLLVVKSGTVRAANVGNISVRDVEGTGKTYNYIPAPTNFPAPRGLSRSAFYSVPANTSLDIVSLTISINRTDTSDRWGSFTFNVQKDNVAVEGLEISCSTSAPYRHEASGMPINSIEEKSDIWITCLAVSQSNLNCSAGFIGVQRAKKL